MAPAAFDAALRVIVAAPNPSRLVLAVTEHVAAKAHLVVTVLQELEILR